MLPEFRHEKSADLDLFRWFAAFMVVAGHSRGLFIGYAQNGPEASGVQAVLLKFFYFITGFPSEAVIVFFVLSGYLVGGGAYKKLREGRFSVLNYAVDRFSRIYIVLIPALLLGALLDAIGIFYFNTSGLYSNGPEYRAMTEASFEERFTILSFIGSALQLQNIATHAFGSNSPLWSLAYECWFYLIWGLVCWGLASQKKLPLMVAALIVGAAALVFPLKALYFIPWLIGVLAAAVKPPKIDLRWLFVVLLCAALIYSRIKGSRGADLTPGATFLKDFVVSSMFGLFIWSRGGHSFTTAPMHERLASFSFSLYIIHYPWIMLLAAALNQSAGISYGTGRFAVNMAVLALAVGSSMLLAWLFALATEQNTSILRARMHQWLGKRIETTSGSRSISP